MEPEISDKAKKKAFSFVAQIDEAELAVRLMEVAIGLRRPPTETRPPEMILHEAKASLPQEDAFQFDKMARRAIEYFRECVEQGQKTN